MKLPDRLQALNNSSADLDMENIGSWPLVLKGIVLTLLFIFCWSLASTCMWTTQHPLAVMKQKS